MFNIFKKKNTMKKSEPLILGGVGQGKVFRYISMNGLDLYDVLKLLREPEDNTITIIELSNKTKAIYTGNTSNYKCERLKYEVIKVEKVFSDNSYLITVINHFHEESKLESTDDEILVSERNIKLISQNPQFKMLTMEDYCKWYNLYLIDKGAKPTVIIGTELDKNNVSNFLYDGWVNHCIEPKSFLLIAKELSAKVDIETYKAVVKMFVEESNWDIRLDEYYPDSELLRKVLIFKDEVEIEQCLGLLDTTLIEMEKEIDNIKILCPYCGHAHPLSDYVDEEDNEIQGRFLTECNSCKRYIGVEFEKKNGYIVDTFKSKGHVEIIDGIEDIHGLTQYAISSNDEIPKELLEMFHSYIGINAFKSFCNTYSVEFEEFRYC